MTVDAPHHPPSTSSRRARRVGSVAPLLCGALVAAGIAAAPAHAGTSASQTVARTASPGSAPVTPGVEIDHLGVQWRGPAEGGAVRFERRGRWQAWRPLHAGELHRPGWRASELVGANRASRYQVRLPAGGRAAHATAIDVPDASARPATAATTDIQRHPFGRGCFKTRADWGADESLRFDAAGNEKWAPAYFEVQRLTVHHTATEGGVEDGSDPVGLVQAIYRYHAIDLNFGDIGYQLLVDRDGCVYEGRHSGDDGVPVYAGRQLGAKPAAVNAGHTAGYNAANVGVAVIGNYDEAPPTVRALRATTRMLTRLARHSELDPLATGTYVNPISGATKDVPMISGHRDWLATACPGEQLYALLPGIRERVADRL